MQNYTIKEAAELSGLPESTLRYYEKMGLIGHIKRDVSSGHRVYGDDDINFVVSLACLSATGMSIEDMRRYLDNAMKGDNVSLQLDLLNVQKKRLVDEARSLKLRQKYVDIKIEYWLAFEAGDKVKVELMKNKAREIAESLKFCKK